MSNATRFPRPVLASFPADEKGRFIARLERGGVHRFWFTGREHNRYEVPIYDENGDSTDLRVVLSPYPYEHSEDSVRVLIYRWADGRQTSERLTLVPDSLSGIVRAGVPSRTDSVEYAIRLTQTGATYWGHGPTAGSYRMNREGRFESWLYPGPSGEIGIAFDPATLNTDQAPASYTIVHGADRTLKFAGAYDDYARRSEAASRWITGQASAGKQTYEVDYDWSLDLEDLDRALKQETDPFVRQVRFLLRLNAGLEDEWLDYKPSADLAQEMIDAIPPTSPLWSFFPAHFALAMKALAAPESRFRETRDDLIQIQQASTEYLGYVHAISHDQGDETSRPTFLSTAISWTFSHKQFELFDTYYTEFMAAFGDTPQAERIRERYRPEKRIAVGQPVPDFALPSLNDPSVTIQSDDLLGTTYLMNFWATWCGPCVTKMEVLTRIHDRYRGDPFTILGVSLNFSRDEALEFRKQKWSMPWLNAHVDGWQPGEGILRDFEVVALPKAFLVDARGIIVAIDDGTEAFYDELIRVMGR